jgi:hypothetical protein
VDQLAQLVELAHRRLGALGIAPEVRVLGLDLDRLYLLELALDVKDTSGFCRMQFSAAATC